MLDGIDKKKMRWSHSTVFIFFQSVAFRPLQKCAYLKMAKCFDDPSASSQQIQSCLGSAGAPVNAAQNIIQGEMNQFQNRLQRCSMDCQDIATDKFSNQSSPSDREKFEREVLGCMQSCVDKHITLLKNMGAKLESEIDRIPNSRWHRHKINVLRKRSNSLRAAFPSVLTFQTHLIATRALKSQRPRQQ